MPAPPAPRTMSGVAIDRAWSGGAAWPARSAIDGQVRGLVEVGTAADVARAAAVASDAFLIWRTVPAPKRGELVRRIGERARRDQDALAALITDEVGKITTEARGEIQEWIDLCEFAVGLSRQLHGLTIASERPGHRLMEQWHPLGPVGIITAFNFPVAVWAWNAMLALVCGDPVVWKPSEKAMRCAIAVQQLVESELLAAGYPPGLCSLVNGGADVGRALAASPAFPLISATGSTAMGRSVAVTVADRLGRSLLELGGNNALIVTPSADLALAERAILFAAVGTAGQRCTSLRRLIVHRSLIERIEQRLTALIERLPIGDPRDPATLVGPLIDGEAAAAMARALTAATAQGGRVIGGGLLREGVPAGGTYVRPALVRIAPEAPIVQHETFAPILYLHAYDTLDQAIAINNGVSQGLSSAIITGAMDEAERFLAVDGSDCGIANVNLGTSGAEIGGAFGGEKATGGGRESGSDAWRNYMRRTTNTVNYSGALPLAQGVRFEV